MTEKQKAEPILRRYVVTNAAEGKEVLVKATSPSGAVALVYLPNVRLASGDDIERLTLASATGSAGRSA